MKSCKLWTALVASRPSCSAPRWKPLSASSQNIAARIENQEGALTPAVAVWQMDHPDLKATHTFGDDKKVLPKTSSVTAALDKNGFTYTFPAHSLTILHLRLE